MKIQVQYCHDILARIEQIERFTRDGKDTFMADDRTQEAVIRCFEVIGEAIRRMDANLLAQYPHFAWSDYIGFRNVLIHQYDTIQIDKIWQSVEEVLRR
jgi:uncharacterized protein with HEPN domain